MSRTTGFTLIEIVMVILLVAILAVVAIPNFVDFRKDAKNAATNGALGSIRGGIAIARASIALRENPATTPPAFPTLTEMQGNAFIAAAPNLHPVLAGNPIADPSQGIPNNAWTGTSVIHDCTGQAKGTLLAAPNNNDGWCYDQNAGTVWANSNLNGGPTTENNY